MPPFTSVLPPMTTHHANNHANKNKRRHKQSPHMEQFQRSLRYYNHNNSDKINTILKINRAPTWLQTAKDNIRIPKHNTKQMTSHNGSNSILALASTLKSVKLTTCCGLQILNSHYSILTPLSSLLSHSFLFPIR